MKVLQLLWRCLLAAVFVILCHCNIKGHCNDEVGKQSQMFVFAIPVTIGSISIPRVLITTSSEDLINVKLAVPGFSIEQSHTINRRRHANIALPSDILMTRNDGIQNKTIIVRSSGPVSVHAIDDDKYSGDGFLVYPTTQLGTKYYVSAFPPSVATPTSFCCITSLVETVINVTKITGQIQSVLLRQYESFRFDGYSDLSGTLIQSNRDIYVTSGAFTQVPLSVLFSRDGLLEQLLPVRKWGTKHFLAPFRSLNSGYVYRIYTSNISTVLNISDGRSNRTKTLQPSDRFFEGNVEDDAMATITSDQPVMIMKYMKSWNAKHPGRGNPSMILVPSLASFKGNVTFPVFKYNTTYDLHTYYINVIIACSMMKGIQLSGQLSSASESDEVNSESDVYSADRSMCCVRRSVCPGQHFVMHSDINAVFSVSVYAIGEYQSAPSSSYAYIAGEGTYERGAKPIRPSLSPTYVLSSSPQETTRTGQESDSDSSTTTSASTNVVITSAVVSCVVVIIVTVIIIIIYCRRSRQNSKRHKDVSSSAGSPSPTVGYVKDTNRDEPLNEHSHDDSQHESNATVPTYAYAEWTPASKTNKGKLTTSEYAEPTFYNEEVENSKSSADRVYFQLEKPAESTSNKTAVDFSEQGNKSSEDHVYFQLEKPTENEGNTTAVDSTEQDYDRLDLTEDDGAYQHIQP